MNQRRRVCLQGLASQAWLLGLPLGACATADGASADRIIDTASGGKLSAEDVLGRMRQADIVLMGEVHDNPHHHARRARLLRALAESGHDAPIVVEHLQAGAEARLPMAAGGDALRQALEAAGFDARAWRWPLHEPLFAAVAQTGQPLHGGNLARDAARRVAREGLAALPPELRAAVEAAPLSPSAGEALMRDLQTGHCGMLPASRLPAMAWAQRGRDAAMAAAATAQIDAASARAGRGPVVLLAGNGHVRLDYGVPQLLASRRPGLRMLSIGFTEPGSGGAALPALHHVVWTTPAAQRDDPCAAFASPPAPAR